MGSKAPQVNTTPYDDNVGDDDIDDDDEMKI